MKLDPAGGPAHANKIKKSITPPQPGPVRSTLALRWASATTVTNAWSALCLAFSGGCGEDPPPPTTTPSKHTSQMFGAV